MNSSYVLRSKPNYELLAALTILEKARYMACSAQQLKYDILLSLLPTLERNLNILHMIPLEEVDGNNFFVMSFYFSLKTCILTYEKVIQIVKDSNDDTSLYKNVCLANKNCTLEEMCKCLDSIWKDYWHAFHKIKNPQNFLRLMQNKLVGLYSAICIKGNESLPDNYKCLSCCKTSAYLKTGITNECDNEAINKESNSSSMNYCYHLIDEKCTKPNINRIIFEIRMNELGTQQC